MKRRTLILSCTAVAASIGTYLLATYPVVVCRLPVNRTHASMAIIKAAAHLYKIDTGQFPSNASELRSATIGPRKGQGYLPIDVDLADAWGTQVAYARVGSGFELRAAGPDAIMGTEDDTIEGY